MDFTKLERLLRFHRQHVFACDVSGDRHHRALLRLKKTETFKAMCQHNREMAIYRASEKLLRTYA